MRLIIALCFVLLSVEAPAQSLIQPFVGHDEDASAEYLFGRPSAMTIDSQGNLYVADELSMDIKKYNRAGKHLGTYGQRGNAPGEYQSITSITTLGNSGLLVYDGHQSRVTILDNSGTVVRTHRMDRSDLLWPRITIDNPNQAELIFLSKMPEHPSRTMETVDSWVHVYDRETLKKNGQFGNYEFPVTGEEEEFAKGISQSHPGNAVLINQDLLVVSPGVFYGSLYVYKRQRERWVRTKVLKSESYGARFVEIQNEDDRGPGWITRRSVNREPVTGRVNAQSAGLYSLGDSILHFVFESEDEKGKLIATKYSLDGDTLGSTIVVDGVGRAWHSRPIMYVLAQQSNNSYYMLNISDGQPKIQKLEMRWN